MLSNKRKLKKVLAMGTVTVASLLILSAVSSVIVFNSVFQRRASEPYDLTMSYTAEDAESCPRREISFMSGDNRLRGFIYGEGKEKGIILIINGFHAEENAHLGETFFFVEEGYTVLTFTPTGVGKSEGDSLVGLEQTRLDALAALDYIESCKELSCLPLFLYGHSAGGYAAACLCGDGRVSAAVSISGFDSPAETMRCFAAKYVGAIADIEYPVIRLYDRVLFGEKANQRASEMLESTECPVLIIHGSEDETISLDLSIYSAVKNSDNENIRTLLIDGEYRNRHSTVWLNPESARRLLELEGYKDNALEGTGGELPPETEDRLLDNVKESNTLLRDVDCELLGQISDFFMSSLPVNNK